MCLQYICDIFIIKVSLSIFPSEIIKINNIGGLLVMYVYGYDKIEKPYV